MPDRLLEFRDFVKSYDYRVGDLTHRPEMQKLLHAVRGKPEAEAIKLGLLKSLKRAVYDVAPLGHYGLAKVNYTHFTSPIRRYADLVVHRALALLTGEEKRTRLAAGDLDGGGRAHLGHGARGRRRGARTRQAQEARILPEPAARTRRRRRRRADDVPGGRSWTCATTGCWWSYPISC